MSDPNVYKYFNSNLQCPKMKCREMRITTSLESPTIDNITSDISLLDARLDTAEQDITSLDGRLDTAEQNITSLDGRLDTAEQDITSLDGRLDTAEQDITSLDGRLDTAEQDITSLDGRLDTAEQDITSLDGRIDTIETKTQNQSGDGSSTGFTNVEVDGDLTLTGRLIGPTSLPTYQNGDIGYRVTVNPAGTVSFGGSNNIVNICSVSLGVGTWIVNGYGRVNTDDNMQDVSVFVGLQTANNTMSLSLPSNVFSACKVRDVLNNTSTTQSTVWVQAIRTLSQSTTIYLNGLAWYTYGTNNRFQSGSGIVAVRIA